jgi:ATP-binding cassette subfamily C protein CydD
VKPLDPRLLRHARAARGYVLLTAGLGVATAAAVVAQAWLLAHATAPVITGEAALPDVLPLVGWLAAVLVLRAAFVGVQERYAHRAATRVVAELRAGVLARAVDLGPRWLAEGHAAATTTLATRGLDALEPYFVRYLPQLLLAVTVTPAVLAVIAGLDLVAAVTIAVTIPLVPIFMVLVGRLTERYAAERLEVMRRLGAQLLDLLAGLATLKALGRERGPAARVRDLGAAYRRTTMQTLRVAFLSGAVLELLATLSVALVAVGVGLRLVYGELDLTTGLLVLVLAPEVYLPLRQVGTHFHASADGVAAAREAFAILDERPPGHGDLPAPDLRATEVAWDRVGSRAPGRDRWAPAELSATVRPGRVLALAGENGSGKSTAAAVLLGLVRPDRGRVILRPRDGSGGEVDLADVDAADWWRHVVWVPQRPALLPGSLLDNVLGTAAVAAAPGRPAATPSAPAPDRAALDRAAALTGLDAVVAALPRGWDTPLGHGGAGLSIGQRQRVALTRALLGTQPLVVLDEPTAHLDARSEEQLVATVRAIAAAGRAVVVVAHRRAVLDAADEVVTVRAAPATPAWPAVASPAGPGRP